MIILHCMPKETWETIKAKSVFGEESIGAEGFIHCSSIEYFWRVTPNFRDIVKELVLLCIDTKKLTSPVKWEDGDNSGREYPHIYGLINLDAVVAILPYLKGKDGNYIKNREFAHIPNR